VTKPAPPLPPPFPPDVLDGFRALATSQVSDCLDRLRGAVGLRPFHASGAKAAGCALTGGAHLDPRSRSTEPSSEITTASVPGRPRT
jgi:hypothetical protein